MNNVFRSGEEGKARYDKYNNNVPKKEYEDPFNFNDLRIYSFAWKYNNNCNNNIPKILFRVKLWAI